jgi:hypothetical protein
MTRLLGLVLILILPIKLFAQVPNFTGKVLNNETNVAVAGVNVSVYNERDIIFHTISDSAGTFSIPSALAGKINHIKISAFNFDELLIKDIPKSISDKNSFIGTFKITPHVIELNEVKIKASKRYRDTTKIDLSGKKFERSVMIDDIFSTNGFSKDANGQLFYKGKQVADLLVNGGDFFGKNNKEVYNLLPALVLDNIEVVETNIDSTTNTTTLKPTIKVNLKFKPQYNKGKFGNASAGLGTAERYLTAVGLYTYTDKQQLSLTINSNNINIGDVPLAEPPISFTANGNNIKANSAKLTYNNIIAKKLEIDLSAKGRIDNKDVISESERQDQVINQFSKTTNKSNSKLYGITDARLRLKYKIDSLNTLQFTQTNDYNKTTIADSINYIIQSDNSTLVSRLSRQQEIITNASVSEFTFNHFFTSKKGRGLNVLLNRTYNNNKNNELDNAYNLSDEVLKTYYVDGKKATINNIYTVNADYTEPLSDNSYLNIYSLYKNDGVNYNSEIVSDSLTGFLNFPVKISNQYFQSGFKFQKTLNKISLNALIAGLFNKRNSTVGNKANDMSFFNFNLDVKAEYQINSSKELSVNYATKTNYPELNQLINFTNSYDLISQMSGNLNLKPEIKNSLGFTYRIRKSTSTTFSIDGDINYYNSKFGLSTTILPDLPQNIFIDNIGHAFSAKIGTSLQKRVSDKFTFGYNNSISYQEQPTVINNKINLNNGFTISQTFSTSKELIKNILTISPIFTAMYSKYYYETSNSNIFNLTYSDRFSLRLAKFEMSLYPLINYSHNINSLTSFSMNGGIKRTVFGNGAIWLQGYDLFNSFKFNNNSFGATYVQSVKYSNVTRYFILGLSFKFNNIK